MAVGVEHRAREATSRLEHALLLPPVRSNAMSYDPLANASGAALAATETTVHHGAEDRIQANPTNPISAAAPSPHQESIKKRRSSKGKIPAEIRRSSSTPHMRNLALGASGELSPTADKRRNKLGYHRTSVACGHCRRRKIRCLLADDPQGRCANCIRLKKECNFYPVEQNPEPQRSQTGPVKDGVPASSGTSSPRHPTSISGEKIEEFRPPYPVSSGAPVSRYGVPSEGEVDPHHIPPSSGMPMQHPPYAYSHAVEAQWPPAAGFLPSSSVAGNSPTSANYWRPPSTANSAYGSETNVSGSHTPATMSTTSNLSYGAHQENPSWGQPNIQPPTRSMSYGNIEGLPPQYPGQGLGIQPHDYPRRTSPYPYPTTIDTSPSTLHSTTLGSSSSAPLSAPILPNQQYTYPPTWGPYGGIQTPTNDMPMSGRSMSGQWYAEPGHLDQVQEEGAPPVSYSHHGLQQFYSGT
ncbi:hypothetical protein BDV95DRAFT_490388 [Massariosphaeria phaeospora]|uniref:Zn(2)-C6 fungal-type domain-containing protein n=1 Tax=Massariosphaeria phaeospora TaxID=100035 RepID=A0A7C8MCA2_9PLEO|nr:hypothetical protein BDV95DRAFT_490388 [Massariosphaeria phaeospora]